MGHQVNFFALPADLPAIEEAIRARNDVCLLTDRTPTAEPAQIATLSQADPRGCYIVRREDLDAVTTRLVSQQGYWVIAAERSPVIELTPGVFDGRALRRGRPELPRPDFVSWGDRVLSRIRRRLAHMPEIARGCYLGPAALRWIREHDAVSSGGSFSFIAQGGEAPARQ